MLLLDILLVMINVYFGIQSIRKGETFWAILNGMLIVFIVYGMMKSC